MDRQFYLSIAFALAIRKSISDTLNSPVYVKWPNDIYVADKKIAGLLIQSALQGQKIKSAILGLGLNVNEESFDEKLPNPTSLRILTEKEWNLERVWSAIEINLRIYYNLLADRKFNLLHEEYEQMLYKRKDSMTLLLSSNAEYKGQILGVNERGQLKFLHNGDLLLFNFHEVRFL